MIFVHDFLKTSPFDLYALHLFGLVARHRSFTKAAEVAGLTQSAITRQIQQLEESLGVNLLDRTTRSVHITPAGQFLCHEASSLLGNAEQTFVRLRQEFANAKKEVRVGVSRSIAQSHLPGLFHANLKHEPHLGYRVTCLHSTELIAALERHDLDVGILCPPKRLPATLRVTHRFDDTFTLISPASQNETAPYPARSHAGRIKWAAERNWLMFDRSTNTGSRLHGWMIRKGWKVEPAMELDSFDLIIQLVALGMGVSLVPIRALALFGQKHHLKRLATPAPFVRELVVVTRRHRKLPAHLDRFIERILF